MDQFSEIFGKIDTVLRDYRSGVGASGQQKVSSHYLHVFEKADTSKGPKTYG